MVRVLSVTSVSLSLQKTEPPSILVEALGKASTPGWKNIDLVPLEAQLSADGILDLEFVGTPPPPDVLVPAVIRDVVGDFVISADVQRIVGVVVHARTNTMLALLGTAQPPTPPAPQFRMFDGPRIPGVPEIFQPPVPPKTFAGSEEGPDFTTFRVGEEATTLAVGEETTFHVGEEFTTLAVGEETTVHFGEEFKTFQFAEEGTMQHGESPPLSPVVEHLINKPPQAEVIVQQPFPKIPDPGPLQTPFGQR